MEKDNGTSRLLQDFSVIAANLLPIVQLFFAKLPDSVTKIFLKPEYFTGVSLITLLVSYVLILAYNAKPYWTFTFPFQRGIQTRYDDYGSKLAELSATKNALAGQKGSAKRLKMLEEYLKMRPAGRPLQIKSENLVSICVWAVVLSGGVFVVAGQLPNTVALSVIQSIAYVFLITFSVLVLTLYRHVYISQREFEGNQTYSTERAINLAIKANSFGILPQVKYISSFDDNSVFPVTHHVRVEFGNNQFEIIADQAGKRLFAVYQLKSWQI